MSLVVLNRSRERVQQDLASSMATGQELLAQKPKSETGVPDFRRAYLAWEARTEAILENTFKVSGFLTSSPKGEFTGTAVSLLGLKIDSTTIPWGRVPEVVTDIEEKLRVLESIQGRLDIYNEISEEKSASKPSHDAPIFLVHGHALERRETVRRFLERVTDREVVVLADQANRGQDILGKLITHAQEACFAVVLLTPDDYGRSKQGGDDKPRARQNVVFELGLFIGLLGRDRVAALNDTSIEIPTDFAGVAYIPIEGESWQLELARELKAAGISVSVDRILYRRPKVCVYGAIRGLKLSGSDTHLRPEFICNSKPWSLREQCFKLAVSP